MTTLPTTNGNVAGVRYAYQAIPWDSPLSFGVQAMIEFNGYVINDRYQSDRIRVYSITGLDDADSTDSREVVPGDHGETVYDSWYRGRALDDETPIPTPAGWLLMKELKVGDQVFDDQGQPCNVLGVYPQPPGRPCYEVWFSSGKGAVSRSCLIADAEHRWETVDLHSRRRLTWARKLLRNTHGGRRETSSSSYRGVRADGNQWVAYHGSHFRRDLGTFATELEAATVAADYRVQRLRETGQLNRAAIRTTEDIRDTLRVSNGDTNHAVRIAGPLEYPDRDLPVEPYLLGAWLGDGSSWFPKLYLPEWDKEVIDNIRSYGYTVDKTLVDLEWLVRSPRRGQGLGTVLKRMGLLTTQKGERNKHIPSEYLQSSITQRRALLAGLMDTDGTVGTAGRVEFDNTNERLAKDVLELALSLGYRAVIRQGVSKRRDGSVCGPNWNISFVPNDNVFGLSRKTETWRSRRAEFKHPEVERFRYIVDVKPIESRLVRCIAVDSPSHLYLAGREMIPTHNTFVMTGQIQAGSLGSLKRMEQDFKAAYAPLVESPMKFRWFDVYDSFDDPNTLANYTPISGFPFVWGQDPSPPPVVSGGVLQIPSGPTSQTILLRTADNKLWGDSQTTVRIVAGSPTDGSAVVLTPVFVNVVDYLQVAYSTNTGSPSIDIQVTVAGRTFVLASTPVTGISQGQPIWLRAKREGDLVTAELWTTPPTESTLPAFSTQTWLSGSDADAFGDSVLSQIGVGGYFGTTTWALDDFQISSLYPGDISFPAKKMPNGMSIKDSQDSLSRFSRNFQLTMRTSQSFAPAATQSRSQTLVPTSLSSGTQLGFTAPLRAPLHVSSFIPGSVAQANNLLYVHNRGKAFSRPLIYVYGATGAFTLVNLTNDQQVTFSGQVQDGDYLMFDCARRTLVDSTGANMLKYFSSSTPFWIWLEAGWNDLYVGGSGYSSNTKVVVYHRHHWL